MRMAAWLHRQVFVSNVNGPQTLAAAIVHAACGQNNGSITASATGGTGGLQYYQRNHLPGRVRSSPGG